MYPTVEGVFRNGEIELAEIPPGIEEARVIVIFMPKPSEQTNVSAEEREAARKRSLERMEQGYDLGGPPYPKREELYDRFDRK